MRDPRRPEYLHPDDPRFATLPGRTINVTMPERVDVLVYENAGGPSVRRWTVKIVAVALDVDTGERAEFGQECWYQTEPTRREIHRAVMSWLDHEVAEQLCLRPHDEDVG